MDADKRPVGYALDLCQQLAEATPLKAILDNEMKRMILSNKTHSIYDRRFLKPIAAKNTRLNLPMNHMLRYF